MIACAAPPSVLPDISPTDGESGRWQKPSPEPAQRAGHKAAIWGGELAPSVLLPCGGDARQGRGGYQTLQTAQTSPGKNIAWR